MTAFEWANWAWDHHREGPALTVPSDALSILLDHVVELRAVQHALDQRIKVTIEAGPIPCKTCGRPFDEHEFDPAHGQCAKWEPSYHEEIR